MWTAAQRSPGSLTDFTDVLGDSWGSQRYQKELDFMCLLTGLSNIPIVVGEYGTASAPGVPDSVGSAEEVAHHLSAVFIHAQEVQRGIVKTPEGRTVVMPLLTLYDEYAWHLSGSGSNESYGFLGPDQNPRTEGGIYSAYQNGAKALVNA